MHLKPCVKKVPIEYKCRANSTLRGQPVIYISHRVRILRDQVENITNYRLNENILKYVGIYFEKTFFETMGLSEISAEVELKEKSSVDKS
uniref:Uncharacterized protein n=1 Tax=Glossina palpalis gambiensis TaxID=67801 RepID=A0A1B0BVI9_9MUSC